MNSVIFWKQPPFFFAKIVSSQSLYVARQRERNDVGAIQVICTVCAHAQQEPLVLHVCVHPEQFWSASNPAFWHSSFVSASSRCGRVMMMAVIAVGSSNAFMPLRHFLVPKAAFCNTHAAPHRCLPAFRFLSIPPSPSCSASPFLSRTHA